MSNGQSIKKNDFLMFEYSSRKSLALVLETKPGRCRIVYVAGAGLSGKPQPFWMDIDIAHKYLQKSIS